MNQKLLFAILLPFLCLGAVNAQDACSTAVQVTSGVYTVIEIDGPNPSFWVCAPNSGTATMAEWYVYYATQDTSVTVTTDLPQNTGGDTRFNVYSGNCTFHNCEAGDDDSGSGLLSVTTFQALAGVTYYIVFDNRWSADGFDFQIIESAPLADAVDFTPHSITLNGSAFCVVDADGDNLDDVIGISSTNLNFHMQQQGGGFTVSNVTTPQADYAASWSMCAGDLDNNGFVDFLYGGGGGATVMMSNVDGTAYTEFSPSQYIFSQRTNMVDINNDGWLDAFICHDVDPNVYYMNDGNGGFNVIQGGLGDHPNGGKLRKYLDRYRW